jgi:hypothetical protein
MHQTRNITTTAKTPCACAAPRSTDSGSINMHNMRSTVQIIPRYSPHDLKLRRRCNRPPWFETRPRHRDPVLVTSVAGSHVTNRPNRRFLRQHHYPSPLSKQPSKRTNCMRLSFLVVARPMRRCPTCRTGPQCAAHSLSFGAQPVGFKQRATVTPFRRRCPRAASRRVAAGAAGAAAWVPQWAGHRIAALACFVSPRLRCGAKASPTQARAQRRNEPTAQRRPATAPATVLARPDGRAKCGR